MATKNNPGKWDCYANADPDEPMFVLLGRDPTAALLVRLWCSLREELGGMEPEKLAEARRCAEMMEAWAMKLGKETKIARTGAIFLSQTAAMAEAMKEGPWRWKGPSS